MIIQIFSSNEAYKCILQRQSLSGAGPLPNIKKQGRDLFGDSLTPDQTVKRIINDVQKNGNEAISRYTRLLEGNTPETFLISREEINEARNNVSKDLFEAINTAANRIRSFHEKQPIDSWTHWDGDGGVGQMIRPLDRVGVYVPGGKAAYPSSLLMAVIPARIAGVREIVVATPPGKDGQVSPAVMTAASVAGVDKIYQMGGAQAIAALAYGTETISGVDKIVGPGNIFVSLAKRQVYGVVDIDQLAGPTETLIIADEKANPEIVAADLIAQAEHDEMATSILLTPSITLAEAVQKEVEKQITKLDRLEIVRSSLEQNGGIVLVTDLDEAITIANDFAPEHLCLLVNDWWPLVKKVKNAGGLFLGENSSEALGDYVIGPSHIMPTNGSARFSSPLNVRDFVKIISLFAVNQPAADRLSSAAIRLAEAEGLSGHATAIKKRLSKNQNGGVSG